MVEVIAPGLPKADAGAIRKRFKDFGYLDVHAKRVPRSSAGSAFWACTRFSDCACGALIQDTSRSPEVRRLRSEWVGELTALVQYLRTTSSPEAVLVHAADVHGPWESRAHATITKSNVRDFGKGLVRGIPAAGVTYEITGG